MTDHSTLERRLREAADPSVWDAVSPDAWQQNEQRLVADAGRRRIHRLQIAGVAAVAAAVVVLATVAVPQLTDGENPASGDPKSSHHLKGGVEVLRVPQAKGSVSVEMALRTGKGNKVDLCERIAWTGGGDRSPGSSTWCGGGALDGGPVRGSHVAYLSAANGKGIEQVGGTTDGAVDKVRGWTSSGKPLDANLIPLNRGNYRGFAFLGQNAADRPALIAVLGPNERILEVVDVQQRLSGGCPPAPAQPAATSTDIDGVRVDAAASGVSVWVPVGSGSYDAACLAAAMPFPAAQVGGRVIALLPPDTTLFDLSLETAQGKQLDRADAVELTGTPWRIAVFNPGGATPKGAQVVLRDQVGGIIAAAAVAPIGG